MRATYLAATAVTLAFTAACSSNYSSAPTSPSSAPLPISGAPSSAVTIPSGAATLANRAFSPDELDVEAGDTVTWTNTDSVAHTSTSDHPGWDSGTVAPGGRFSFEFRSPGTYQYHCAIHPGMVGTVVVR